MRASGLIERFVCFYKIAKSFGLYSRQEKLNQKKIPICMAESNRLFAPVLFIAKPLITIK